MAIAKVNGINIYYEITGEGKPLVLINGLGSAISKSSVLAKAFSSNHKVLAFDNRGAGRTDKPDEPYSLEQMATDTAGIMKATGFNKAAVLGVSMGGRIALDLALTHPEMVDKLVLVSTSAYAARPKTLGNFLAFSVLPRLPILKGQYPQPYYAFKRQNKASKSYNCLDRLGEIKMPTLITHGRNDGVAPIYLAQELHNGIRGSKLETFRGGHLFFVIRERQNFLSRVEEFLSQ